MIQFDTLIEIPLVLMLFGATLTTNIFTNLISYQTCIVSLNRSMEECALLGTRNESEPIKELQAEVQKYAAVIQMTITITESFLPAFIGLFLGPWSDLYGRKPILLLSFGGVLIRTITVTFLVLLPYLSPWVYVFASIPVALSGGTSIVIAMIYCFISDIVPAEDRTFRIVILSTAVSTGSVLGQSLAAYLFNGSNYLLLFSLTSLAITVAFVYFVVVIRESLPNRADETSVLRFANVKDLFAACVKPRIAYNRAILLSCTTILLLYTVVIYGNMQIDFFFMQRKFSWNLAYYNIFTSAVSVTSLIGTLVGVYVLNKIFNVSEYTLLTISLTCAWINANLRLFASNTTMIWSTLPFVSMVNVSPAMLRSIISLTVPNIELGKIFSVIACLESILPVFAVSLYTYVYNMTVDNNPGLFNLITSACLVVSIAITGVLLCLPRVVPNHENDEDYLVNSVGSDGSDE